MHLPLSIGLVLCGIVIGTPAALGAVQQTELQEFKKLVKPTIERAQRGGTTCVGDRHLWHRWAFRYKASDVHYVIMPWREAVDRRGWAYLRIHGQFVRTAPQKTEADALKASITIVKDAVMATEAMFFYPHGQHSGRATWILYPELPETFYPPAYIRAQDLRDGVQWPYQGKRPAQGSGAKRTAISSGGKTRMAPTARGARW
jgi:hypothetical protein